MLRQRGMRLRRLGLLLSVGRRAVAGAIGTSVWLAASVGSGILADSSPPATRRSRWWRTPSPQPPRSWR
jgi:hypothetical protein